MNGDTFLPKSEDVEYFSEVSQVFIPLFGLGFEINRFVRKQYSSMLEWIPLH